MISARRIKQLIERAEAGQIADDDLDAFMRNPGLWRTDTAMTLIPIESAQAFWQGVWNELTPSGLGIQIPSLPKLTAKQKNSLGKFGFLPMYLPDIEECQYPADFVKLNWGQYLDVSQVERKPLTGQWVAVETIRKPHWDEHGGYPDDRLRAALKRNTRFNTSHDDLTDDILQEIAKVTGFPKKGTRLPSAEEWNLVGNLFNWLRERHSMPHLPDLGSTRSMEWCENAHGSEYHLVVGSVEDGGLAYVGNRWHDNRYGRLAFRVLVVL